MYPLDYRYTKNHLWIFLEGSTATIGITDYAQRQLGDIVFVQLPKVGAQLNAGGAFGSIESAKAVNDLFSPVAGEVSEINAVLSNAPELLNKDPHGTAWLLKVRVGNPGEISALMDAQSYETYTADLAN